LGRNANRSLALLGQGGVVDDQPGSSAANQFIRLTPQGRFPRGAVPQTGPDEMMKSVIRDRIRAGCHGLNALAIPWSDQACDIGRAHSTPRLVTQAFQIRREPPLQIRLPVFAHRQPP